MFLAGAFFRPLAWALVHADEPGGTHNWLDISSWTGMVDVEAAPALFDKLAETKVPLVDDHAWLLEDELAAIVRGHIKHPSARKQSNK